MQPFTDFGGHLLRANSGGNWGETEMNPGIPVNVYTPLSSRTISVPGVTDHGLLWITKRRVHIPDGGNWLIQVIMTL